MNRTFRIIVATALMVLVPLMAQPRVEPVNAADVGARKPIYEGDVVANPDKISYWYDAPTASAPTNEKTVVPEIKLKINNITVTTDVPPYINSKSKRTMVPLRVISEALESEVNWDQKTQTVTITRKDQVIKLVVNQKSAKINGKNVALDAAAEVKNGRTLVPIRFIAENFGATVNWLPLEKVVELTYSFNPSN